MHKLVLHDPTDLADLKPVSNGMSPPFSASSKQMLPCRCVACLICRWMRAYLARVLVIGSLLPLDLTVHPRPLALQLSWRSGLTAYSCSRPPLKQELLPPTPSWVESWSSGSLMLRLALHSAVSNPATK